MVLALIKSGYTVKADYNKSKNVGDSILVTIYRDNCDNQDEVITIDKTPSISTYYVGTAPEALKSTGDSLTYK